MERIGQRYMLSSSHGLLIGNSAQISRSAGVS